MLNDDIGLPGRQEDGMDPGDLSGVALARAGLYKLLADCLNHPPDAIRLRALRQALPLLAASQLESQPISALHSVLDEAGSGEPDGRPSEDFVTEAGVERTRSLRGVKPGYGLPPATESVYSAVGEPTWAEFQPQRYSSLISEYAASGFSPATNVPPDFLGNEVAYLAFLCRAESAAWIAQDHYQAMCAIGRQIRFLDEHPMRWIERLLQRVQDSSTNPFWPSFLSVLIAWLRSDREYLLELLEDTSLT